MIPVFIYKHPQNSDGGYNISEFEKYFISICEKHHHTGRALAFVFILYDRQHATLSKVLEDKHYWNALDQLSGHYLSIFYIDTGQTEGKKVSRRLQNPFMRANAIVHKYITNGISNDLPSLLFFQVDHMKVTESILINLKEQEIELCFSEIVSYMSAAIKGLKKKTHIVPNDRLKMFDHLQQSVQFAHQRTIIKKMIKQAISITEFLSGFIGK